MGDRIDRCRDRLPHQRLLVKPVQLQIALANAKRLQFI
jgi:hypothetical protein